MHFGWKRRPSTGHRQPDRLRLVLTLPLHQPDKRPIENCPPLDWDRPSAQKRRSSGRQSPPIYRPLFYADFRPPVLTRIRGNFGCKQKQLLRRRGLHGLSHGPPRDPVRLSVARLPSHARFSVTHDESGKTNTPKYARKLPKHHYQLTNFHPLILIHLSPN